VIHLLIRGIGLCGATGELDCTLEPDEATCPSCRVLIGMLREKDGSSEVPCAPTPLGRVKIRRRRQAE
jgi:hypothetical protein